MSNDPIRVSLSKVVDFLRDIGLDPVEADSLRSVHIDPGVMTVVRHRRDGEGRLILAGNNPATETTTIRVDV